MMSYINAVEVMDCGTRVWSTPPLQAGCKAPVGRCAKPMKESAEGRHFYKLWILCSLCARFKVPSSSNACLLSHFCTMPQREDTAWAYDSRSSSLLLFGGWANCWLGDLLKLNVSSIIGPPYACTGAFCVNDGKQSRCQLEPHRLLCAAHHLCAAVAVGLNLLQQLLLRAHTPRCR